MKKRKRKNFILLAEVILLLLILFAICHSLTGGKALEVSETSEAVGEKSSTIEMAAKDETEKTESITSSDSTASDASADLSENVADGLELQTEKQTDSQAEENKDTSAEAKLNIYSLFNVVKVEGRQGICASADYYYVSSSKALAKYDKDWNLITENTDPFAWGYEEKVNHIGDLDVSGGKLYCLVEKFSKGQASNLHLAVYDAESLQLLSSRPLDGESGQEEGAGICVNKEQGILMACEWGEGEAAKYLYEYDLATGAFLRKIYMENAPEWIQGITYYQGDYYLSADDGNADQGEADHIYRVTLSEDGRASLEAEKGIAEVTRQGEIEGLSFDEERKQLLVLYNFGQRIVDGAKQGFYEGFDEEEHEVYLYSVHR